MNSRQFVDHAEKILDDDTRKVYNAKYLLEKLRLEIYTFMLSRESEDDYYNFFNKTDAEKELIPQICTELENVGWKWKLGFGDSALFIYKNDVPVTCWG